MSAVRMSKIPGMEACNRRHECWLAGTDCEGGGRYSRLRPQAAARPARIALSDYYSALETGHPADSRCHHNRHRARDAKFSVLYFPYIAAVTVLLS
jgi:hypothetical protein